MIALVVLASIAAYAAIAGVTYEMTEPDGDDYFRCYVAGALWPLALPAIASVAAVRRIRDGRSNRAALPPARVRR